MVDASCQCRASSCRAPDSLGKGVTYDSAEEDAWPDKVLLMAEEELRTKVPGLRTWTNRGKEGKKNGMLVQE